MSASKVRAGRRKSYPHVEPANQVERADYKFMVRMKPSAHARLQMLADQYAGGNLSAWLRYAGEEAPRVHLVLPTRAAG